MIETLYWHFKDHVDQFNFIEIVYYEINWWSKILILIAFNIAADQLFVIFLSIKFNLFDHEEGQSE